MDNHQFPILTSIFFSNVLCIYFNWTHGQLDTLTNTTLNGQPLVFEFQLQYSSQMYSLSIFIGHMDNWTHRRTKLLMDNHQFNFNILLKCIVNLFTLDTWTTAQRQKFYTTCPGLYRNTIPTLPGISSVENRCIGFVLTF